MSRWADVPVLASADVCDAAPVGMVVVPIAFSDFGGRVAFHGPVQTVIAPRDNSIIKHEVCSPGDGRVLVVDGEGAQNCALVGGNLAGLAAKNGWAGIIINGMVRDRHELIAIDIGIKALGTYPVRSDKQGHGSAGLPLSLAGTVIKAGDYVVADGDGVVITPTKPAL